MSWCAYPIAEGDDAKGKVPRLCRALAQHTTGVSPMIDGLHYLTEPPSMSQVLKELLRWQRLTSIFFSQWRAAKPKDSISFERIPSAVPCFEQPRAQSGEKAEQESEGMMRIWVRGNRTRTMECGSRVGRSEQGRHSESRRIVLVEYRMDIRCNTILLCPQGAQRQRTSQYLHVRRENRGLAPELNPRKGIDTHHSALRNRTRSD